MRPTKYSVVIELDYKYDDELSCKEIERNIGHVIKLYLERNDLAIAHLESSVGSLHDAFGVGFKSITGTIKRS